MFKKTKGGYKTPLIRFIAHKLAVLDKIIQQDNIDIPQVSQEKTDMPLWIPREKYRGDKIKRNKRGYNWKKHVNKWKTASSNRHYNQSY